MTDNPEQFATAAARLLQGTAQACADRALRLAQSSADRVSTRMPAVEECLVTLAAAGLRLADLSHRCLGELLKQGHTSARGALADSADRLRMTSRASSLGALYKEQRDALPASRARLLSELESTWQIVTAAGRELSELARSTGSELLRGRVPDTARTRRTRARKHAAHGAVSATERGKRRASTRSDKE
ncbi:MAG TPA: hypothetical protein VMG11_07080 [Steroidobacteraceae bacterium]|nr:hypothetical protein [Steroidobacteraceae bacterium]